jgi:hypothetical protein
MLTALDYHAYRLRLPYSQVLGMNPGFKLESAGSTAHAPISKYLVVASLQFFSGTGKFYLVLACFTLISCYPLLLASKSR